APLLMATAVFAQTTTNNPQQQQPPPASSKAPATQTSDDNTRRATTTYEGDTGLWFVPTGEILPDRKWSFSFYRAGQNREAGFTNVAHFLGTFGIGIGDRAEIFTSVRFITRIDRDIRPLYIVGNNAGGFVNDYPYLNAGWSGDHKFGDTLVGA